MKTFNPFFNLSLAYPADLASKNKNQVRLFRAHAEPQLTKMYLNLSRPKAKIKVF